MLSRVFEESEELANFNAKTKRNHQALFNQHIKDLKLDDFNSEFMIRTLNSLTSSYSDDTISRVFRLFKQIDDTAILKGYYSVPRCIGFKAPKSKRIIEFKERITNVETLRSVLNECDDPTIIGIILTAYYTGMRPGEIFALNKDDIVDGWIRVNKQIGSDLENEGVVRNTKTPESTRMIPVSVYLKPVLERFTGPILFPSLTNEYYYSNLFNARTARLFRPYNLTLYKCRHLFATTLEYSGVDRITIDALMGHSVKSSTDIYVHTDKTKMIEAIGKLGDQFGDQIEKLKNL